MSLCHPVVDSWVQYSLLPANYYSQPMHSYVYSMHTATIQGPLPYYSLPMNSHLATHTQIFFCKNITHNNVHVVPLRTNLAGGLLGTISQKSALQSFHIANLVASCCLRISAIVGILSLALSLYIPPC